MHTFLRSSSSLVIACAGLAILAVSPSNAASKGAKAMRFTATAANTSGTIMTLDHPVLNGKPSLRPIVTQYSSGVLNPHPVGLRYSPAAKKWQIVNEDNQNIPVNTNFNVLVAPATKRVDVGALSVDGLFAHFPIQKGNPNAKLLISHVINPISNVDGVLQTANLGLFQIGMTPPAPTSGRWSIYQEDLKANLATSYFVADVTNLKAGKTALSFRHLTATANTTDNATTITNALTDGKPEAMVFVQHLYTAAGQKNVDKILAVTYAGGKWKIIAQDAEANMPVAAEFNVLVLPAATVP